MRLPAILIALVVYAGLSPTHCYAQTGEPPGSAGQPQPFHTHRDNRHGHDHVYPDRGALLRDLPKGSIGVLYAGVSYRYHDGIWLEPRGPAFMVVAPPIGLLVPRLPAFVTVLASKGETYLYANDVYYRPRPDLQGYEVVNDPSEGGEETQETNDLVGGALPANQTAAAAHATSTQLAVISPAPAAAQTTTSAGDVSATSAPANRESPRPSPLAAPTGTPPAASNPQTQKSTRAFLYPRNGQSEDQQARDRYECYRFAVTQSGFDPVRTGGAPAAGGGTEPQPDFARAEAACFEARGYTTR